MTTNHPDRKLELAISIDLRQGFHNLCSLHKCLHIFHKLLVLERRKKVRWFHKQFFFSRNKDMIGRVDRECRNVLLELWQFDSRFCEFVQSIQCRVVPRGDITTAAYLKTSNLTLISCHVSYKVCILFLGVACLCYH